MQRLRMRILSLVSAVAVLQGCAIVSSQRAGASAEGIAYMLPKALLPVTLTALDGALELAVGEPVLLGDSAHTYVLQRSGNIFTSDNVTINVDPKTGLLTAADVKSDDKTLQTVIELLKGRAEAATASTEVVLFSDLFDPGAEAGLVADFNARLNAAAAAYVRHLLVDTDCTAAPTSDACKAATRLQTLVTGASGAFAVTVQGETEPTAAAADCSAGLCYRLNVPHVVKLSGPLVSNSAVFGLPNRSPTFVLPLERWAFVKTSHDVKLEGGVFESVTTDRPSSALAVAAAPVAAASAVLSAAAQIVQFKVDLSGKEKALADARIAEINAKAKLDELLLGKVDTASAEAALLGGGRSGSRAKPLSIRVGAAPLRDATAGVKTGVEEAATQAAPAASSPSPSSGGKTSAGSSGK